MPGYIDAFGNKHGWVEESHPWEVEQKKRVEERLSKVKSLSIKFADIPTVESVLPLKSIGRTSYSADRKIYGLWEEEYESSCDLLRQAGIAFDALS